MVMKVLCFGVLLSATFLVAGCESDDPAPNPSPTVIDNSTDSWPVDHCGEPYKPGTTPRNQPGNPCP